MDVFFSDFDSISESSSSDDQDDAFMYGGQASCILSSMEETIGKIDDFLLFERGYMHGDIVCSIEDPSGQIGRVSNVDMVVDLENAHGEKVNNVFSKKLQKIRSVSMGDYVVSGPWVGKVEKLVDCVTVLFDDGTKCEFTTTSRERLIPLSPDLFEDSQYLYYPGQRVQVELSSMSKSARWLCGARKEREDQGTVCAVDAGLVHVDWLGCALLGHEKMPAPPSLQSPKDLTLLSCFSHSNWQLGDLCILPHDNHKGVGEDMTLKQPGKLLQRRQRHSPSFQEIFVIAKTKTKVDVLWQDGSQSSGLETHSLYPVNIVDAHDFWPEQFVLEKGVSDDPHIRRWGVVKFVDAKERTVRVNWKTSAENHESNVEGHQMEETVSAYELVEHPDYLFCHGDVVFRLQKEKNVDETSMENVEAHHGQKCFEDEQNIYLSQIGIVVGFKDGNVDVKWATGFTSKVAPHEIFRVDKSEGSSATPGPHDEYIEPNEEKTEQNNQSLGPEEKDLQDCDGDGKDCLKSVYDSSYLTLPQAAIGFFNGIATGLLGSLGYTSLSGASNHVSEDGPTSTIHQEEEVLELSKLCTMSPPSIGGDFQASARTNVEEKFEETQDKELPFLSSRKNLRQFDMVGGCSDHHFIDGAGKGLASSQVKRGWMKKVQQEWSILEKDLPETIYVRAYEERMDLLRAAIVGAPGTPYHDNLFFFDIFLPPDYPLEPPMVHYNSGGLRVNPNLYESGKVCLSLLNTWTGAGNEVWNPVGSTVLQVLLSLQALVLNEKPYFNEAGYDKQIGRAEGEKNSVSYNENAFIVSCKSMLYLLRKPPKHFEELMEEHFRQRCKYILMACKAYQEGIPVGCAFGKENTEREDQKGSSTGFKIMLAKLFPKLVEAFSEKGIDCSEYI